MILSGSNRQMDSVPLDSAGDMLVELSAPKQSGSMVCHTMWRIFTYSMKKCLLRASSSSSSSPAVICVIMRLVASVMNELTSLPQNTSEWHIKFPWKITDTIKRQIYRSNLWSNRGSTYANLYPPSLHIKQLILSFEEVQKKLFFAAAT